MAELKKLPKDRDITIGFIKQYGTKTDILTFFKGDVNLLEKKDSQLYPLHRTTGIDKISLYATTHSGSNHLLDISEGNLIYRLNYYNSDPTTSIVLTNADVTSLASLRSALQTKLKAKLYAGQQFTVTI